MMVNVVQCMRFKRFLQEEVQDVVQDEVQGKEFQAA